MALLNIKFADGNELISYNDDAYCESSGCPTCGYGATFVNEMTVLTTNYQMDIELCQSYSYAFDVSDAIKIFAVNLKEMTEIDFVEHIKTAFYEYEKVLRKFNVAERK